MTNPAFALRAAALAGAALGTLLYGAEAGAQTAKRWDLSVRAFADYDDNVALAPDDDSAGSQTASLSPGVLVSGGYRFYESLNWTLSARGGAFHKHPLKSAVEDFNVTAVTPALGAQYRFWVETIPVRLNAGYGFRQDWVGGQPFSASHSGSLAAEIRQTRDFSYGPRLSVSGKDFDADGDDPDTTSRDAISFSTGAFARYAFGTRLPTLTLTYDYGRGFAEGNNFDTDSHSASATITMPVFPRWLGIPLYVPVFVSAQASYSHVEHVNFATEPRRVQDNYSLGGTLYVPLGPNLSADLSHTYSQNDSNAGAFTTKRNVTVFGVTYRF